LQAPLIAGPFYLPHHYLIATNSSAGFGVRDILHREEVYACCSAGYRYIGNGTGNMIVVIDLPAGHIADVYAANKITVGCANDEAAMIGVGVDGEGLRRLLHDSCCVIYTP